MNKVTTTHIWAPGGRYKNLGDWEWAWSFTYVDRNGEYHDKSSTHLFKDGGECEREMRKTIEEVEGLTSTSGRGIMMSSTPPTRRT